MYGGVPSATELERSRKLLNGVFFVALSQVSTFHTEEEKNNIIRDVITNLQRMLPSPPVPMDDIQYFLQREDLNINDLDAVGIEDVFLSSNEEKSVEDLTPIYSRKETNEFECPFVESNGLVCGKRIDRKGYKNQPDKFTRQKRKVVYKGQPTYLCNLHGNRINKRSNKKRKIKK